MFWRWCLALALLPGLGGCAALYNVAAERAEMKVYGGTRWEVFAPVVLVCGPEKGDPLPDFSRTIAFFATFELPLTFAVDTLTLPITVPVSIYRHYNPPLPDESPSRPDVVVLKGAPPPGPRE
jgi:hypothetical protein